ncbi:MAG: hypothetical protein A2X84_13790 [Desulfuromonadaceae bacterium GWC2_58_13]|nr:MAG: hypothetical protein A2X84_13790 [Desulfuromonadaceae bacterium GWC2_58_13]
MKGSKQLLVVLFVLLAPIGQAIAMVRGECVNCHTMHNSQNGSVVGIRPDSAFSPKDADNFTVVNLLNNTCIGCHSSSSGETIVSLGQTRIPIVLNLSAPAKPLAGGNFFWVETSGDGYGHNVRVKDGVLSKAPGGDTAFGTVPNGCSFGGCHASLASIRYDSSPELNPIIGNGCVGCHDPAHHADDERNLLAGGAKYVDEEGGGYRFLNKAGKKFKNIPPHSPPAVAGIEDPDWEQNPSATRHNEYQDSDKPWAPLAYGAFSNMSVQGISDFCGGCHNTYHSWPLGGLPNGGYGNPWLRHPASIVLPASGEYDEYRTYDPTVPVARADAATLQGLGGASATVTPGSDKVMCLSCHRAHGSPFPDMLRWDYSGMLAGTPQGASAGNGCFKCHTQKDD